MLNNRIFYVSQLIFYVYNNKITKIIKYDLPVHLHRYLIFK